MNSENLKCADQIDIYLKEIYKDWEHPIKRNTLFGKLPIKTHLKKGFSTDCPPIPWMGDIINAEYALISLEPLLDNKNFKQQIEKTTSYREWRSFYFQNYFNNFFGKNGINKKITSYWGGLTKFLGYLLEDTKESNANTILNRIVEIPFCQYHIEKHISYKPDHLFINDFKKRLNFYLKCNVNKSKGLKIIVLGTKPFKVFDEITEGKLLDKDLIKSEGKDVRHKNPRVLKVKKLYGGHFFMRNAPFSNGWALNEKGLERLATIIRNYKLKE